MSKDRIAACLKSLKEGPNDVFHIVGAEPLFRYKLRQLERFVGRESYTAQMKRLRLISVLKGF
jgi:hypothetical protein